MYIRVCACVCVCVCVCVCMLCSVLSFVTPWTVDYQALLSMRFSRQEHWNGLPFPSPGDVPVPYSTYLTFLHLQVQKYIFLRSKLITQKNHTSSLSNVSFISKKKLLY